MSNFTLKIQDTLSNKKQEFIPLDKEKVKMYVCGITPYDYAHIGHGRVYVTFDVFYRLLKFLGFDITYARNYTDIDDKLLNRSQKELGDKFKYQELAEKYIDAFKSNMSDLNCLSPDYEPKVTDNIQDIINFVQGLIDKGKAYQVNGDVYYSVRSFPSYTKLSKKNLEDLQSGARVDIDDRKKDPLDFALWKSEREGEFWKSPWGYGRPGWHIECSALAKKFLGEQIDIHAGGIDLIFPHHENEIAQSEGLHNKEFSKYWMHNAFVRINQEKMSKSLGNFFTLNDVFKEFDPALVRYYYLIHSYNTPLDFSFDDLKSAEKSYQRLCKAFENIEDKDFSLELVQKNQISSKMLTFLLDDLNTPGLFGVVFENLKDLSNGSPQLIKFILKSILGLKLVPLKEKEQEITPEIEALINQREEARKNKDWATADKIRDQLKNLGVKLEDKKLK